MIEVIAAVIGLAVGFSGKFAYDKQRETSSKHQAEKTIVKAERKASEILLKAKDEAIRLEQERRK
jgi:hypothetical protein